MSKIIGLKCSVTHAGIDLNFARVEQATFNIFEEKANAYIRLYSKEPDNFPPEFPAIKDLFFHFEYDRNGSDIFTQAYHYAMQNLTELNESIPIY